MTTRLALRIDLAAWIAFALVWLVAAARVKRDRKVDPLAARLLQIALSAAGVVLIFVRPPRFVAGESWQLVPSAAARAWLAALLPPLGIAFAVAARLTLGRNWSGRVTLKEGHELIVRGPYRLVRHPIYAGLLLALLGSALLHAQLTDLAGVAIFGAAFGLKMGNEERLMAAEFGEAYAGYRQRVKALVPFVI